ncbi:MAG: hypothetical protein ABMA25_11250 [Ilumatobacteraceae bacterium]
MIIEYVSVPMPNLRQGSLADSEVVADHVDDEMAAGTRAAAEDLQLATAVQLGDAGIGEREAGGAPVDGLCESRVEAPVRTALDPLAVSAALASLRNMKR